jgi:hypothetical protein
MREARALLAVLFLMLSVAVSANAATKSPALDRALSSASDVETVAAWIIFKDKPASPDALSAAAAALTPHARARRERNMGVGPLVDAYDLPVDPAAIEAVRATGAHVRQVSRWLNAVSVDATPQQIATITALASVARLDLVHAVPSPEPVLDAAPRSDAMRAPQPQRLSYDYGSSFFQNVLIDVPAMHDLGLHGEGVIIAVLDTGFNNFGHEAFASLNVLATYDFVNHDTNVSDQVGQMGSGLHGTWVLGTIAGFKPGELIGPAFGATFVLAKTENTQWERHLEEDAWVAAAEWADSIGADIISSSLVYLKRFFQRRDRLHVAKHGRRYCHHHHRRRHCGKPRHAHRECRRQLGLRIGTPEHAWRSRRRRHGAHCRCHRQPGHARQLQLGGQYHRRANQAGRDGDGPVGDHGGSERRVLHGDERHVARGSAGGRARQHWSCRRAPMRATSCS